jgi:RND family efflux transporter MFP subunit
MKSEHKLNRSRRILSYIKLHKLLSAIILIVLFVVIYWIFGGFSPAIVPTKYVTADVSKQTIMVTVGGSGQVSASNQVEIKPKVSGDIISFNVANGQEVKTGTIIAQIDSRDAQKTVRDAEANLESAQLSLQKIKEPADALTLLQSQNTLSRAKETKQNAESDLEKAYEDGFNSVSNSFLDLPDVMTGLQNTLLTTGTGLSTAGQWNIDYFASAAARYDDKANSYRDDAYNKYQTARIAYTTTLDLYKATSRFSDKTIIETTISKTYETTKSIAESVKSTSNLIQFYKDVLTEHNERIPTIVDTYLNSLSDFTGKTNTHLGNLLNATNSIKNDKDSIVNAERTIVENTGSYNKLVAGADELDIKSAELSVTQRENALRDAREKLSDYVVRAPFDGTIATVNAKKFDTVGSGTSLVTLIAQQKIAEISLNEIDAAKIKNGQKATLTFDAVPDLSISGVVASVDALGAVSQGVVSYAVKINFDTQDSRIKSGMSVSASIIIDMKQDVLAIPDSAIKTQGNTNYVQVFSVVPTNGTASTGFTTKETPTEKTIETGIASDSYTEIISGLTEGEHVVVRTISATTAATKSTTPSLFGGGGTRSAIPH